MRRALLLLILLAGCDNPPEWQGFVYPNQHDLAHWMDLGKFETIDQCRAASVEVVESLPAPKEATYECGRSCEWKEDMHINLCTETRK